MHVAFPFQLLKQAAQFRIVGQSLSAAQSISGAVTVVPGLGARWQASVAFIAHTEAQYLAARGFLAAMEGMLGTTDVPAPSWFRPLDRDGNVVGMSNTGTFGDAQAMEHFGFENEPIAAATLAGDASLRATQLRVAYSDSTGLRPGHRFSIAGNLYEVQLAWVDGGENVLQIQPPLRASAFAGDAVEIHFPTCRMRLAGVDEQVADDTPVPARFFRLNFIEAL
jgi:hypothetical protein